MQPNEMFYSEMLCFAENEKKTTKMRKLKKRKNNKTERKNNAFLNSKMKLLIWMRWRYRYCAAKNVKTPLRKWQNWKTTKQTVKQGERRENHSKYNNSAWNDLNLILVAVVVVVWWIHTYHIHPKPSVWRIRANFRYILNVSAATNQNNDLTQTHVVQPKTKVWL